MLRPYLCCGIIWNPWQCPAPVTSPQH